MKILKLSVFTVLFIGSISCTSPDYQSRTNTHWDDDIFLKTGAKEELDRYFDILDAKEVYISSYEDYRDEQELEVLHVNITDSDFLKEKEQKGESPLVLKRLAYLIMSRIEYPDFYDLISLGSPDGTETQISIDDLSLPEVTYEYDNYEEESDYEDYETYQDTTY